MEISMISDTDFDAVLALNTDSVPHVNQIDATQLQWFVDNADYVRVVRHDGRIAAFMIGLRPGHSYDSPNYRWFSRHYEDFAYVDRIATADWARRRGIAAALYEDFAKGAESAPVMTCEVNVRPPNDGSMRFHLRAGFRQIATQETEGGSKEVALMEKKL